MQFYYIFFLLSGFCSLVYQVTWLRTAMADFGIASTMVAVVLSVFMAGLSLGSWCGGRVACRFNAGNPAAPSIFIIFLATYRMIP